MAESRATHLTGDIEFKGDMKFEDRLIVEGKVEGKIESSSKVEIANAADVKADLAVKDLIVRGTVQGNVNAKELVHITSGGKLLGDIDCKQIQIEKGGVHNGTTVMK